MPNNTSQRRQRHGSAWFWKQTDCWYITAHGTKRRQPLFDGDGRRIRGADNKRAAQLALARIRLTPGLASATSEGEQASGVEPWSVARVCFEYLTHCERAEKAGRMHPEYRRSVIRYLNQFCRYCGALPTAELKRGDVSAWVAEQPTWRSPVMQRNVITMILAAFNHVEREHGIRNPLKGLKKPGHRPRLHSISAKEEQAIYRAADPDFRNFLFALFHTGLRPFCELAKLRADHVEETPRGMLWRVYSSKTKKTRKIPVRPEVAKLTRRLIRSAPQRDSRPIFLSAAGRAWSKSMGVNRFVALKLVLGWIGDDPRSRFSCYSTRHTFAHRMLSGYWNEGVGCSIEVLAELIGDTPAVTYAHYGREWSQSHQGPLWAALGQ